VTLENPRVRKLAELVTHHIFGNVDRNMLSKSGRMVERRDQVLIGRLSLDARADSTFAIKW
jgi:hypothetical protein